MNELTFEYWKSLNLLPVMASVQAFGAEAEIASRDGAEKVTGEIPTIKRKIPLNGRALVALRREGAGDVEFVRNTLYNDLDNMIDAVHARIEQMRIDAIATGKIELDENGVVMTVDYGVPANHKGVLSGTDKWSDHANAKPIEAIQDWVSTIVAVSPARAGMDLIVSSKRRVMSRLPRTRGDGPGRHGAGCRPATSPPHARGWTP